MAFLQSRTRTLFWRFLPVRFRRSMLSRYTTFRAPSITIGAKPEFPVIIAGTFRSATGLGQSARMSYQALKAEGVPVKGIDLTSDLSQPIDLDFELDDARMDVGTGTVVLHVNSPLVPLALMKLGTAFIGQKYIIGYWAWELPSTPPEWEYGLAFVHEVWTPSEFVRDAILPIAAHRNVRVLPHPVAQSSVPTKNISQNKETEFDALLVFNFASGYARKNPGAAIAAFRLAFGDKETVRFTIKVVNSDHYPDGMKLLKGAIGSSSNIRIADTYLNDEQMHALYEKTDVVISLHRSEGFGLTIAEGMLHAKPVIATNWSGNTDFMDETTSIPIPFEMIEARDPQNTYNFPDMSWANASIDEAAIALQRLHADPEMGIEIGGNARKHVEVLLGSKHHAASVMDLLGLNQ